MPFGRRSPLETLALPGVILAYKYNQFRQKRREAASRRVTERELSALHQKIDKLLNKLEENEPEPPTSQEDECVICINARATMQTSPCGHRVVCRRCFVKTIQSAVAQRLLPLRCVICRARVNRLTSGSGDTWRIQESSSNYSMGTTRSWSAPDTIGTRVAHSASLYSMSSGSSNVSGISSSSSISSASGTCTSASTSRTASTSSIYTKVSPESNLTIHRPHEGCGNHCQGAISRNAQYQHHHHHHQQQKLNKVMQNRLPPIKEFRSPAKVTTNAYNMNNPRLRSVSKSNSHDTVPLLASSSGPKIGLSARVAPIKPKSIPNISSMSTIETECMPSTSRNAYCTSRADEKATNRKNENLEKRRKEEKLKLKAEKDARKEAERLLAKEEKKRNKKSVRYFAPFCDRKKT